MDTDPNPELLSEREHIPETQHFLSGFGNGSPETMSQEELLPYPGEHRRQIEEVLRETYELGKLSTLEAAPPLYYLSRLFRACYCIGRGRTIIII